MRSARFIFPWLALAAAFGLGACGGTSEHALVRVGHRAITATLLSDRVAILAPEHVAPDPPHYTRCVAHAETLEPESIKAQLKEDCAQQYQALKQQALELLISCEWQIAEAAREGIKLSEQEVQASLQQADAHASGARLTDLRLTSEAEVAGLQIRRMLAREEPKITHAQIARYYKQNARRYERPERRSFDIVEHLPSEAAASALMRATKRKGRLPASAIHETFDQPNLAEVIPEKKPIMKAIFKAKPHVLTGPVMLNDLYAFFEVTHIRPALQRSLAETESSIEGQLATEQQRRRLTAFIAEWRRRSRARTNCRSGYVVQKCRQYHGTQAPEDPLAFN